MRIAFCRKHWDQHVEIRVSAERSPYGHLVPETFNNVAGSERGFWQRQSGQGAYAPQRRVC